MMVFDNTMRPGGQHDPKLAARGRSDFAIRADTLSKVIFISSKRGCEKIEKSIEFFQEKRATPEVVWRQGWAPMNRNVWGRV